MKQRQQRGLEIHQINHRHLFVAAYAVAYAYAAAYASSAGEYVASAATNATYAAEAAGINKLDEQNRQGTFILNFFEAE